TARPPTGGFADAASEQRFHDHVSLADRLARRYSFGSGLDDDLRQVAHIGLFLACQRFDPDRGVFVRFASVTIIGELKKHLRSTGWSVRVPRALQEDSITVASAVDRLTGRFGRSPTIGEIAEHTGFDRDRVAEALLTKQARFATSVEQSEIDVAGFGDLVDTAMLRAALDAVDDDVRRLIELRHVDGLTQSEIGRLIGISQPQVHRRLARAEATLREQLREVQ
ncbi:MAG: sigma-70 family RNA polymerase sigma factor, partial [Ilumatobacter sp.]|uniref:sigma-70 family RNA polymerase sigma factor n=1 Tax=Ilumatobacter sp. TaxID=1967498 RepID=UPI003296AB57